MTVVAALKFYDQVAACEAAGEAKGAHGGFGAAGDEANFLHERNRVADALGELDFEFGGYAVAGAFLRLIGDGGGDGGIGVAEKHGTPRAGEVQELGNGYVGKKLPLAAFDD